MTDSSTEPRFDAETESALDRAAEMLTSARMPLIYGLSEATLEAQAVAVDIAEALRCVIDTPASQFVQQRGTTLQLHGGAHTTLGEFYDKLGDLEILLTTTAKFSLMKDPDFKGDLDELQLSYQHQQLHQSDDDYLKNRKFIHVPASEVALRLDELLVFLKAGTDGLTKLRSRTNSHRNTNEDARWDEFHTAYQNAKYPLIHSSMYLLTFASVPAEKRTIELELIQSLLEQIAILKARDGRAAYSHSSGGYHAGADYVLTARTGASCAISFASGRAEHSPLDFNATTAVKRGLVDAVLFIGESATFDPFTPDSIALSRIAIGAKKPKKTEKSSDKNIFVPSRDLLSENQGTVLRSDGVPIPWRPNKQSDRPSMELLLKRLLEKIRNTKHS